MKTHGRLLLITCLFLFILVIQGIIHPAHAQENFYNTLLSTSPLLSTSEAALPPLLNADTATSACNGGNTFWGIENSTGILKEFDLTNNVITFTGNFVPSCAGLSLGICNNLNGGSQSPTFYTNQTTHAIYWDGGNTWITAPGAAPATLYNCSGNGTHLYYYSPTATTEIINYDGSLFTTIFSTTKLMGCADIAVDNSGNFIFVSAIGSMSDSIFVISPAGQILQRYPLSVNVGNAYGCFLLNSVFYLGLGSFNSVNPNSLIPVTFTGTSAITGLPILLPAGTVLTADLASCNPGSLVGINEPPGTSEVILSPNPAMDYITISGIKGKQCNYTMYDAAGSEVNGGNGVITGNISVNISKLSRGVYFVELKTGGEVIQKHFYKM